MQIQQNISYKVETDGYEVVYLPEDGHYWARVEPTPEEQEGQPAIAMSVREPVDQIIQKLEDTKARMQAIVDGCHDAIAAINAIERLRNE